MADLPPTNTHGQITTNYIHIIHNFEYADADERLAATLTTEDIGKVARQVDDHTFWIVRHVAGDTVTWGALLYEQPAPAQVDDAVYIPLVFDGANESIVYLDDTHKVPNFVTNDNCNIYYIGVPTHG